MLSTPATLHDGSLTFFRHARHLCGDYGKWPAVERYQMIAQSRDQSAKPSSDMTEQEFIPFVGLVISIFSISYVKFLSFFVEFNPFLFYVLYIAVAAK